MKKYLRLLLFLTILNMVIYYLTAIYYKSFAIGNWGNTNFVVTISAVCNIIAFLIWGVTDGED